MAAGAGDSPTVLGAAELLEQLSDRQAAEAVRSRIDWKYALGLELTDAGFHFSVLTEFRARLVNGQSKHLLLDMMLERFRQRGLLKAGGKQRTDSTYVLAAIRDLHLLELVAETLRATLDDLAAVVPEWLRGIAQPVWFERYAHRAEDYRLPKSQEKREALALTIGADGFLLLDALDATCAPAVACEVPMVATLRTVWRTHYSRDDRQLRWKGPKELPATVQRVQSPYDPEAHYSAKRGFEWVGYKVHLTEVCDEDAVHLITHVETCLSTQPDMTNTAGIHKRLAVKELLPAEHFVDSAYVDADLLIESQRDYGVSLEGPVRGVRNQYARAKGYEQRRFTIDWDRKQATCPQGKTSVMWRTGRDKDGVPRIGAVFSRRDCGNCAVRLACTPAKDARRVIYFHPRPEYEALNAARDRMNDPAWQERYQVRAGVEGTISQGVRVFGMRRSRYIGLAKTGLQQACAAAAMNVLRATQWLAGMPRAKTRVTRLAALAPS